MPEKHGYEDVGIFIMRNELRSDFPDEATTHNLKLKKKDLALLLNELKRKKVEDSADDNESVDFAEMEVEIDTVLETIIDTVEDNVEPNIADIEVEIDEDIPDGVGPQPTIPTFNSAGWSDYVKGLFLEDELQEGYPKCDGLRRLVEELVGPIVTKTIRNIKFPTSMDNTASVCVSLECLVTMPQHPAYGKTVIEEAVSDANPQNNNADPFSSHMSSVAETRAESRAYRKLLRLKNVVSAEEATSGDTNLIGSQTVDTEIQPIQIEGIDRICQRLDINVMDFINTGDKTYNSITDINGSDAKNMLKTLNEISSEGKKRPESIGSYDKNWRN
jgi:hypothetical protein